MKSTEKRKKDTSNITEVATYWKNFYGKTFYEEIFNLETRISK